MDKHFLCGAAKRSIAPPEKLYDKLFCVMPFTRFQRMEGGLFVRVIAIGTGEDVVLLIHYELDQAPFPHQSMERIHEKYGIPVENMFFLGNHSHEVPVTGIRKAEPQHNEQRMREEHYTATTQYEALVIDAMLDAVEEALQNRKPARIAWSEGESLINRHRDMDYPSIYPLDRTLFVLKVEALDGSPIAFMLNYSTHNSCVKMDDVITADLEGCVSAIMEDRFKGAVSIWTLSAHGDIMPRLDDWNIPIHTAPPEFLDIAGTKELYFRRMYLLSMRQFEDALNAMENMHYIDPEKADIAGSVRYVDVPTYRPVEQEDGSITHMGGMATLRAETRAGLSPRAEKRIQSALAEEPMPYHLRLHITRIGPLVFVGNGGKLYNSYKMLIRNMLPIQYQTVILSQDTCEDCTVTYVLDDRAMMESASKGEIVTVRLGSVAEGVRTTMKALMGDIGICPADEATFAF